MLVLLVLFLDGLPLEVGNCLTLCVGSVLAISRRSRGRCLLSETIIVRRPYGYFSTPKPIQQANQTIWMWTKGLDRGLVPRPRAILRGRNQSVKLI